jgi:hypothetical protein
MNTMRAGYEALRLTASRRAARFIGEAAIVRPWRCPPGLLTAGMRFIRDDIALGLRFTCLIRRITGL